jgi:NAD(P)-dependent dehydrogenase (short-subunit alcohol dehydrogenase family)
VLGQAEVDAAAPRGTDPTRNPMSENASPASRVIEPAATVLVTGASSGIGLETAVGAARAGFRVVATVRDLARTDALTSAASGLDVEVRRLDVTDPDSVTECVSGVIASHGRLDALVNNAGAGHVGTVELDSMEEFRAAMEVNYFGVVAMTQAAMPHLRAAGGRIVSISSVGGIVGQPFNEAYCAAKFALEGFMESLAPVAATVGVRVVIVEPGAVASSFVANAGVDREAMLAAAGPYAQALAGYVARTAGAFANAQTAESAAAVVVSTLVDESRAFRVQTSDNARAFVGIKLADLDGARVQAFTGSWVTAAP